MSTLASAPLFGNPQKVVIGASGAILVSDADGRVVAFFGPAAGRPFDLYVRDYLYDDGTEPTTDNITLESPDVLLRSAADIDPAAAATSGLESIPFQQPQVGHDSAVYLAVHNRGPLLAPQSVVRLYWADPYSKLAFPADWKTTGISGGTDQGTSLLVPPIAPHGVRVVGPLSWRPPLPGTIGRKDGKVYLLVRVVEVDDPTQPTEPSGWPEIRRSNNVAMHEAQIACTPQCQGRVCGPDQCGFSCGSCAANLPCNDQGQCICVPACGGHNCGPDNCGGSCGQCQAGQQCKTGQCIDDPCAACTEDERCVLGKCVPIDCVDRCPPGSFCDVDGGCLRCPNGKCEPP